MDSEHVKRKVAILGFPRSGQHAIVNWLFSQSPNLSLFLNNYSYRHHGKIWYFGGNSYNFRPTSKRIDLCGYGLEGAPGNPNAAGMPKIYVIRDIRNHVASLAKHPKFSPTPVIDRVYEQYCNVKDGILVKFPLWHVSEKYRRDVFEKIINYVELPWSFTDVGRSTIMGSGGGSSFTRERFKTNAHKMSVNTRYKRLDVQDAISKIPRRLLDLDYEMFPELYNGN